MTVGTSMRSHGAIPRGAAQNLQSGPPLVRGPALYTGDPVREGLCTLAFSRRAALYTADPVPTGLCTLGLAGSVQTPVRTTLPVYKVLPSSLGTV